MFKSVYVKCPRNVTALYALGHCCERLGREDESVAFYQDCLKSKISLSCHASGWAAIYFKNGQIEKAIREYEKLREEYPDDLSTSLTLGVSLYRRKQIQAGGWHVFDGYFDTAENFCPETIRLIHWLKPWIGSALVQSTRPSRNFRTGQIWF